jgi:hypothetical protein
MAVRPALQQPRSGAFVEPVGTGAMSPGENQDFAP